MPAGLSAFYPTNLNKRGDLRGHPRERKPGRKNTRSFRRSRRDYAKTAIGNIFHFPFKGLRFLIAPMQRRLAAAKPSVRWMSVEPAFSAILYGVRSHQPTPLIRISPWIRPASDGKNK